MVAAMTQGGHTTVMMHGTISEIYADVTCVLEGITSKIEDKHDKLVFVIGLVESLRGIVEEGLESGKDAKE